ncbi:MAG: LamG-like jellyroll fold domain-containing protein, partial [Verrucomicrobiota bacterium]
IGFIDASTNSQTLIDEINMFENLPEDCTIPFFETFDITVEDGRTNLITTGDLDGQRKWLARDTEVSPTAQSSQPTSSGANGAAVSGGGDCFRFFYDGRTNVWTDLWLRPSASGSGNATVDAGGDDAVFWVDPTGDVHVYDGMASMVVASVTPTDWTRFSVHSDYNTSTWELLIDGLMVVSNLAFRLMEPGDTYGEFRVSASGTAEAHLDDIGITPASPFAPPAVITYMSPSNNAVDVDPDTLLVARFDKEVHGVFGGVITLTNLTAGTATTFTLPDPRVSIGPSDLIITLPTNLAVGATYAILIDSNSVRDTVNKYFAGIYDTATWTFRTTTNINWNLVAYWPLDDGPLGPVADGTIIDDVVDDPVGGEVDAVTDGNGGAFVYDADLDRTVWHTVQNNRLQAGSTEMNRDFTWTVWARSIGGDTGSVLGTRDGSYARLFLHQVAADGYGISFSFPNNYGDDTWHHLAFTREGNTFTVYVDGVYEASRTVAAGDNDMKFEIGGHSRYASDFEGYMSEVAIWK